MARKFLTAIDLTKNELQNAVIQNVLGPPPAPVKGQIYFDYTGGVNTLYWYDGGGWVAAKGGAGTTLGTSSSVQAIGDTQIPGVSTDASRSDHKHGMPAFGAVTTQTSFGGASSNGASTAIARNDHTHGTPTHDNAAHSAITLNSLAAPTGTVSMGSQVLGSLGAPSVGSDAATKTYVDNMGAGLSWKEACRFATTGNLTQSGLTAVDGTGLTINDRILCKDQSTASQNGIWLAQSGAWTRATDADAAGEMEGAVCFVLEGTANADKAFVCTTNAPITVGTTPLVWVQFGAGTTYTAGNGLTLTANDLAVGAGTGISVAADMVALDTTYADARYVQPATLATYTRKYSALVAGATSTVINHAFNTRDVTVNVYRVAAPYDQVECDVEHTDVNNVTVRFTAVPTAGEYRVVVVG